MASQHMLTVLTVIAVFPAIAAATQFVVGDGNGWNIGYNYTEWTVGKEFRVGDILVFRYTSGDHNVIKVGASDFQSCIVPAAAQIQISGNDIVTLGTARKKWYICGEGNHCEKGQKLAIEVLSADDLGIREHTPVLPPDTSSLSKITVSMYQILLMLAFLLMATKIMI